MCECGQIYLLLGEFNIHPKNREWNFVLLGTSLNFISGRKPGSIGKSGFRCKVTLGIKIGIKVFPIIHKVNDVGAAVWIVFVNR